MKNKLCFPCIGLFVLLFVFPGLVMAQVDKKAAELKRVETGLATAKNNVAKYERTLFVADSLISKGTEQMNESKAETKSIAAERKVLDKEYATNRKSLEKLSVSKDKAEATQAKVDLKALDLKYKADAKVLDTKLKDTTKKSTTGSANLSKGKTNKKTASDGLATAQAALEAAQDKYNAATGVVEEESETKKGKNK